jgi:glycosyltransferase involved in cell wall biosynthesis
MVAPVVDVVIPVHNEERELEPSVLLLNQHLGAAFPFSARITIADNGSDDATWAVAQRLAGSLGGVRAVRTAEKGRGHALAAAWLASDAEVVAYMDVDLSTDLNALLPLVAPIVSGHSDLAIGSRLAHGARVVRGPRRELISRCYNRRWFFDTELLVLAERAGMRITEVPVDWTDDPDSRVAIVPTALEDLRGVWRMLLAPLPAPDPAAPNLIESTGRNR